MTLKTLSAPVVRRVRNVRNKTRRALIEAYAGRLVASAASPVNQLTNNARAIRYTRMNR